MRGVLARPRPSPGTIGQLAFPPAALDDRTPLEALRAGAIYLVDRAATEMRGVCQTCAGRVASSLDLCLDHDGADVVCDACGNPFVGVFSLECRTCKTASRVPSFAPVNHHPVVETLYGTDRRLGADPWAWMWRGVDWSETVVGDDPPRIRTTVAYERDSYTFEVGADCDATLVETAADGDR